MSLDQKETDLLMDTSPPKASSSEKKKYKQKAKNNNSKARREEAFRFKTGQKILSDYRKQQDQKHLGHMANLSLFTLPDGLTLATPTPTMIRTPVSTFGISLAVNELWTRFQEQFRNYCTIYQLFRVSLAQFDFQLYTALQQSLSYYPYDGSESFDLSSGFRNVLRAHPDNFEAITLIVDTIGLIKIGDVQFIPTVPKMIDGSKTHLTFHSLQNSVRQWSQNVTNWQFNPLPGACVDVDAAGNGRLLNPLDFWPENYGPDDFRRDAAAVMKVLENMRAKFDQVCNRCSFSGIGKPGMLISVSDPRITIPFVDLPVPTPSPSKRKRAADPVAEVAVFASAQVEECTWYASYPLDNQMFHLGAFSLVGLTTDADELRCPALRVRSRYSSARRLTDSWLTLFDWLTPKVVRK